MSQVQRLRPVRLADARKSLRHVFVRDLELLASIGVYRHEQDNRQRIRVNLDLAVRESEEIGDRLDNVVCYEHLVSAVQNLVDSGHVNLVETLAERIAGLCLEDPRVRTARVRVEKLDVFANAASVGVEIERCAGTP